MSKYNRVIITGASGLLGSELVHHYSSKKYHVRALVRNPSRHQDSQFVTYIAYDMLGDVDDSIFADADYLIHTAYIKDGEDVLRTNIAAAKILLDKSRRFNISRNIFISSMSADRNTKSTYGRQKYSIEQLFSDNRHDTVIRSGLIIGNGGLLKQIVHFMRVNHLAPLIGNGKQPLQIVSVYDMSKVIDAVIDKHISGMLKIGTPRVYTYKEFYQAIKKNLNIKALLVPVPYLLPLVAIRLVHALRLPISITEDNLNGLKNLKSYRTQSDLRTLDITLMDLDQSLSTQIDKL